MCRCGSDREEESHIVSGNCEVYGDLRLQFGRTKAVLDRRDNLEEEDRTQQFSTAAVGARTVPGNGNRTP